MYTFIKSNLNITFFLKSIFNLQYIWQFEHLYTYKYSNKILLKNKNIIL